MKLSSLQDETIIRMIGTIYKMTGSRGVLRLAHDSHQYSHHHYLEWDKHWILVFFSILLWFPPHLGTLQQPKWIWYTKFMSDRNIGGHSTLSVAGSNSINRRKLLSHISYSHGGPWWAFQYRKVFWGRPAVSMFTVLELANLSRR